MPVQLSDALDTSASALKKAGVFNAFVGMDSSLHVDAHLLSSSKAPEMRAAHKALHTHFENVIKLLDASNSPSDVLYRQAVRMMTFPEWPEAALGYSEGHKGGTGIGRELAAGIVMIGREIVKAGIKDPAIFELVGLFQEGIGPDRLSDMILQIARAHFLEYTNRMVDALGLRARNVRFRGITYRVPAPREAHGYLILFPRDVLRDLPVALSWEDVDRVCRYNDDVREKVNRVVGRSWRQAQIRITKGEFFRAMVRFPDAMRDLLAQYAKKPANPYDFNADIHGELAWFDASRDFSTRYPLDLKSASGDGCERLRAVVKMIVEHFKDLVENKGLWALLLGRHEKMSQLTFYGVADAYCRLSGFDISPEVNSGRGPVDFKFSNGYACRVLVEVKLSSNTKLRHGFTIQLREYKKAERSVEEHFLVVRTAGITKQLKDVQGLVEAHGRAKARCPLLCVVDSRKKKSASKF